MHETFFFHHCFMKSNKVWTITPYFKFCFRQSDLKSPAPHFPGTVNVGLDKFDDDTVLGINIMILCVYSLMLTSIILKRKP